MTAQKEQLYIEKIKAKRIYVASSWKNPYQPEVVEELRKLGYEVYDFRNPKKDDTGFHWSEIDLMWKSWQPQDYIKNLSHPIAEKGFKNDFDAMGWADFCVMVLPCGRSAHTEAGFMKGSGKKVFVYMPVKQESELMYKIYDNIFTELDDLKKVASLTEQINQDEDREQFMKDEKFNGRTMSAYEFYRHKTKHDLKENCGVRLTGEELFTIMNQFVAHCMSNANNQDCQQAEQTVTVSDGEITEYAKSFPGNSGSFVLDSAVTAGFIEGAKAMRDNKVQQWLQVKTILKHSLI